VTDGELELLIASHPILYHMAEYGSWPSIRTHGLLSTTALLDLYGYVGPERIAIEQERRPNNVTIKHAAYGTAVVRDQKPISDKALNRCLQDHLKPGDWYKLLNARVFFWLTEERLTRLLNARPYAPLKHDVLLVDTRALIQEYRGSITLAPINTGSAVYKPQPRGLGTLSSIENYAYSHWFSKRGGKEPVVELAVTGGIPNILDLTLRVEQRQGSNVIETVWSRTVV
jgi:uncharacterized protein DUF7002